MLRRTRGAIEGIVQGVGFRPFIYQLAARYHLSGHVGNTDFGVDLEVEGESHHVEAFVNSVVNTPPPLAHIAAVQWTEVPVRNQESFEIQKSKSLSKRSALISPDVGICADCLRELLDPKDRRFRYPFINCTNCGPRYTIIRDIPYDRVSTTMARFHMCPECRREYENPINRRFHAQPNACWKCGPLPAFHDGNATIMDCEDPVRRAIGALAEGAIVAVKGLGGFHLCVDAQNHPAVLRLRRRKHREEKPLAVMVKDLRAAKKRVFVSDPEAALLTSRQRPIVLLKKKPSHGLSGQVAPMNRYLGVMLPYTPLHVLLLEGPFQALVMTSGNISEEPISRENREAFEALSGIADYFLTHNREIYLRGDDSVMFVQNDAPRHVRRSRGYVPVPVFLPESTVNMPAVLALGGELKNTVCLTKKNRAFLSQHIGDLENLETFRFFRLTISHLRRILEIEPRFLIHDLHPDYLSTRFAREQTELPTLAVQHHHAHLVGCLAEHGSFGPAIGVAMDGTGLGLDKTIWGGELLLCDAVSFSRQAHLKPVPLPGGDAAARSPWRMALVYLHEAFEEALFELPIAFVQQLDMDQARLVLQLARKGIRSPLTSSCGRLFDAVSALLGIRREIAYEGQAAVLLEMAQNRDESGVYPVEIVQKDKMWIMEPAPVIRGIVKDLKAGETAGAISRRFHHTLIHLLRKMCTRIRRESGLSKVALSGGAFQNRTLLRGLSKALEDEGFEVLTHGKIPSNDGGLSLGQAVCGGMTAKGIRGLFEERYEIHG